MERYITVLNLSNHGLNQFGIEIDLMYDTVRYDTEKKEFVYGSDIEYSKEYHQIVYDYDIEGLEISKDELTPKELKDLTNEIQEKTGKCIEDILNYRDIIDESLLNQDCKEILMKYKRKIAYRMNKEICKEYNNNFVIENEKLRSKNKNRYNNGFTVNSNLYFDEDNKLYMVRNGDIKMIFDSKKPNKINKELIDN